MTTTLYRAISKAEKEDFEKDGQFRTGRNTLEVKEFYKTEEAVSKFIERTKKKKYHPPCNCLLHVIMDESCLENIPYEEMDLDGFSAIIVREIDLLNFNKCIKFAEYYDV